MDYQKELKAFYDRLLTSQMGTNDIAVWGALMQLASRAGWPEKLTVPISSIEAFTKLGRQAVYNSRNKLKELGFIDFQTRKGKQSSSYTLHTTCINYGVVSTTRTQTHTQSDTQTKTQTHTQSSTRSETIYIQDKTIQDKVAATAREVAVVPPEMRDEGLARAVQCYEANYNYGRPIPPTRGEEFKDWCERLSGELLALALDLTISETDQPSWQYAKCKLNDWEQNGITDIDGAKRRNEQWRASRGRGSNQPVSLPPKLRLISEEELKHE